MAYFRCMSRSGGQSAPEISCAFNDANGILIENGKTIRNFGLTSERMVFPKTATGASPTYDLTKPFTFRVKMKMTGYFNGGFPFIDPFEFYTRNDNSGNSFVCLWLDVNNNRTYLRISAADFPVALDTWYTVTLEYNNGVAVFTVSDGVNTESVTENVNEKKPFTDLSFGNIQSGTDLHLAFDFSETYWEENGVVIWGNKHD